MYLVDEMIKDRDFTKSTPILTMETAPNSKDETYTLHNIAKGRYFYMTRFASQEILTGVFNVKFANLEAREIQLFVIQ